MARLLFFVDGLLALVVATRMALDEKTLAAWRKEDALWGPAALPFNMAMLLAVGFAYLYATLSPSTFKPGVRLRIGAFVGLEILAQLSTERLFPFSLLMLAFAFVCACAEFDGRRRERKRATVPIV